MQPPASSAKMRRVLPALKVTKNPHSASPGPGPPPGKGMVTGSLDYTVCASLGTTYSVSGCHAAYNVPLTAGYSYGGAGGHRYSGFNPTVVTCTSGYVRSSLLPPPIMIPSLDWLVHAVITYDNKENILMVSIRGWALACW